MIMAAWSSAVLFLPCPLPLPPDRWKFPFSPIFFLWMERQREEIGPLAWEEKMRKKWTEAGITIDGVGTEIHTEYVPLGYEWESLRIRKKALCYGLRIRTLPLAQCAWGSC